MSTTPSVMTPEHWQEIEKLYHSALERDPSQRQAFLRDACAGDEALRREVELLLAHKDQARSFIEAPALEMMAKAMAEETDRVLVGKQLGAYKITSLLGPAGWGRSIGLKTRGWGGQWL